MRSAPLHVARASLEQLHTPDGHVLTNQIADLGAEDLRALLRAGKVRFAIADIGHPLKWLDVDECFSAWKREIQPHLIEPDRPTFLEDLAGEYGYFASRWESPWPEPVVLLLRAH